MDPGTGCQGARLCNRWHMSGSVKGAEQGVSARLSLRNHTSVLGRARHIPSPL